MLQIVYVNFILLDCSLVGVYFLHVVVAECLLYFPHAVLVLLYPIDILLLLLLQCIYFVLFSHEQFLQPPYFYLHLVHCIRLVRAQILLLLQLVA